MDCSADSSKERKRRVGGGNSIEALGRLKAPDISNVFAEELLYCIASYSGWSTALALQSVSSIAHVSWFCLSAESKRALLWRMAILGTGLCQSDNWDRLDVFSATGSRLSRHWVPRPRKYPACAFDGSHHLYILGGCDDQNNSSADLSRSGVAVDSFDLHKEMWACEPNMVTGRADFGACRVGKEIVAVGGFCPIPVRAHSPNPTWFVPFERSSPDRLILSSIDVCQLIDGSWQTRNSLHYRRHHFALVTIGSRLYVIGGITEVRGRPVSVPKYANSIEVISEAGRKIDICTTMPRAVAGCYAVAVGHRILIIGGEGPSHNCPQHVQDFNTVTGAWTSTRLLPNDPFTGHTLQVCSGLCIQAAGHVTIFGGYRRYPNVYTTFDAFLGEAIMDQLSEKWIVRDRSSWPFRFGVAVALRSQCP